MQCVILSAGKGTRMLPLTEKTPKPLIKVGDRAILDHIVEALPHEVDELIIVVSYLQERIREYCGPLFHDLPVRYIEQEQPLGTAHALIQCKDILRGKFLVVPGDDMHGKDALARMVSHDLALLVAPSETPERFGVVTKRSDGTLAYITEKPVQADTNLVSTGVMVLDERIFAQRMNLSSTLKEYLLPDLVNLLGRETPIHVEQQDVWIPLNTPEDIVRAEKKLR